MVDDYYIPSTEDLEDQYLQFIEEHPRFPKDQLRVLFPNLDQLKQSHRVARIVADKCKKVHLKAKEMNAQEELEKEIDRHRWAALKEHGFEALEEVFKGNDLKLKMEASKFVLSGKHSHAKRLGELLAEAESRSNSKDEPYPKP